MGDGLTRGSTSDLLDAPVRVPASTWADRPVHLGCPVSVADVAICGWVRPRGDAHDPRGRPYCVVCLDLADLPCPHCGEYHVVAGT